MHYFYLLRILVGYLEFNNPADKLMSSLIFTIAEGWPAPTPDNSPSPKRNRKRIHIEYYNKLEV